MLLLCWLAGVRSISMLRTLPSGRMSLIVFSRYTAALVSTL